MDPCAQLMAPSRRPRTAPAQDLDRDPANGWRRERVPRGTELARAPGTGGAAGVAGACGVAVVPAYGCVGVAAVSAREAEVASTWRGGRSCC
jgi:hypothetical protein